MSKDSLKEEKRFLGVMELGNGRFAREVQDHFQNAQAVAQSTGLKTTITIQLVLTAPERDMHNKSIMISQCAYHVSTKTAKAKAKSCQLEHDASTGMAITSAETIAGLLQEELKFPEEDKTAAFPQQKGAR